LAALESKIENATYSGKPALFSLSKGRWDHPLALTDLYLCLFSQSKDADEFSIPF
jgi:hypothetical protein